MSANAQEIPAWMKQMELLHTEQLIAAGYVRENEYGELTLTDKGKQRAAARLDKLPAGDEILLHVAFCEKYDIPVSINRD